MTDCERMLFFQAAYDFLTREQAGAVSEHDIDLFVMSLKPTPSYPINVLLEDFVECVSLNTLSKIHLLLERHPLVMDHAEATKMGVLKIFTLFSRRQSEGVGAENMAKFMLLVSGAVSISDRSGVNLRGEKNEAHLKVIGDDYSPLVKCIHSLQDLLYSDAPLVGPPIGAVSRLLTDICHLIQASLVESDDLLTEQTRLPSAPHLQLDSRAVTVDVNTAIVVLVQCLMLIDMVEVVADDVDSKVKEVKLFTRQIMGLLKKTTVGRRVAKLYPFVCESDRRWQRWKRLEQCKDVHQPRASVTLDMDYFAKVPEASVLLDSDHLMTNGGSADSAVDGGKEECQLSEWAVCRERAFNLAVI